MALKGIVIDAGHGGSDPGAIGNGYQEKNINSMMADYMFNRFNELGIPVKYIRSTDETLSPKERTRQILEAYGNDPNVLVISNHINAGGGEGAEVIYALRNNDNFSKKILNNLAEAGQKTRKVYQRRLPSDPSKDYNFLFRDTGVTEPVIVEYGFIDNKNDITRVVNNAEKYAEAVVKAVAEYKNIPYTEPGISNNNDVALAYIVRSGDSLWSIAKRYGLKIDDLKRANNLTSDFLKIGQKLLIPKSDNNGSTNIYVVKSGDTLYSIANKNNISVQDLMMANNLKSNLLSINQQLIIPKKNNSTIDYTVKSGDSLWKISRLYNTTVAVIRELNNLTSDLLRVGQVLKLPV